MANHLHQPLIALGRIGVKRGLRAMADVLWNVIEHAVECFTGFELSILFIVEALTGIAFSDAAAAYAAFPIEGLGDLRLHLKTSLGGSFGDEEVRRYLIERVLSAARQLIVR